ncbi:p360-16R [African swine fever virus]|uniref:p360-16R n=1 Tax=African swine fever virus TaxID=10497 RepID=A0A2Z5DG36_ASF|nr:p360-16R [African swine fever virus]AXB49559.1 p360-16R [African swine fever virus]AXB49731.1 p360-16R [African swine fever virus]AXB49902.1 p360-16R [African swine fever virus]AXB50075.1 p360-16R [African swine fever virus]
MMPSTLQALAKKVLATPHISKKYCQSKEYCHILKCCGLWWHDAPITIYPCINKILIKTASFKHGLELNVAFMKAVQENNYDLIRLFIEWGADINFGLATVNTDRTRDLCRELGAKEALSEKEILEIFDKIQYIKSSSNIIVSHELLSNNPLFLNNDQLKLRMFDELHKLSINFVLHEISFNEMLTRYWYSMAILYNLTAAIQYFYQSYKHFKDWRLICGLAYNNVFDLHEIYNKEKTDMNIDEMMQLACMYDGNYTTNYYCFMLGADINRAMIASIINFCDGNLFLCIDLGADVFEESMKMAIEDHNDVLESILSFKNYYSSDVSLLSLKTTDPEKINALLEEESYKSKNRLIYKSY